MSSPYIHFMYYVSEMYNWYIIITLIWYYRFVLGNCVVWCGVCVVYVCVCVCVCKASVITVKPAGLYHSFANNWKKFDNEKQIKIVWKGLKKNEKLKIFKYVQNFKNMCIYFKKHDSITTKKITNKKWGSSICFI